MIDPIPASQPSIRRIQTYKPNDRDRAFRKRLKKERGAHCECCGHGFSLEDLQCHHILETRVFPEFAREKLNVLVLCQQCHGNASETEALSGSCRALFYASLPGPVRARHLPWLSQVKDAGPAVLDAFSTGDHERWNEKAVGDLTR
jgi:hypothetical protein